MDLWIRSQDREILASASYVTYSNSNTTYDTETDEQTTTKGHFIVATSWVVAEYPTKERALEVLDAIQERLLMSNLFVIRTDADDTDAIIKNIRETGVFVTSKNQSIETQSRDTIVFEMPEV